MDTAKSQYDPMALLRTNKTKKFDGTEHEEEEHPTSSNKEPVKANSMPLLDTSCDQRQTLLLSATLSKGITELTDFIMKDHIYIDALDESSNTNPEFLVIPSTVQQKFLVTHVKHRLFTLSALLLTETKKCSKIFVFMGTSAMVDFHFELFTKLLVKMPTNRGKLTSGDVVLLEGVDDNSEDDEEIIMSVDIFKLHGSMEQSARKDVFTKFRSAKAGILLCTVSCNLNISFYRKNKLITFLYQLVLILPRVVFVY